MTNTVIKNAHVYDKSEKYNQLRSIVINNGRITSVTEDTPEAENVIDAGGGTVFPGFIDSHMHPAIAGPVYMYEIVLNGITGRDDVLDAIREFVENNHNSEAYGGYGYLETDFGAEGPRKEWLDEICPDKPMYISGVSGHEAWLNSKAFEMAEVDENTELPRGSVMPLNEKGKPCGSIRGVMAMKLFDRVRPQISVEQYKDALESVINYCSSEGLTTVVDCEINSEDIRAYQAYKELAEEGRLTARVRGTWLFSDDMVNDAEERHLEWMRQLSANLTTDWFRMDTIKFFADGILEEYTAALNEPYADRNDGWRGDLNWNDADIRKVFKMCDDAGWQIHVHIIGDRALDQMLDAVEYLIKENGEKDRRPEFAHLELVSHEQAQRMKKLGVTAATSAYWAVVDEGFLKFLVPALGKDRAYKVFPIKSIIDEGVLVTSHSDYNVSDPEFDMLVYSAVTRMVPQKIYDDYYAGKEFNRNPDPDAIQDGLTMKPLIENNEFLSIEETIDTATINGAKAIFLEKETGSIELGKKADLVIYDKDFYGLAKKDIESICGLKPCMTLLNGNIVYKKPGGCNE